MHLLNARTTRVVAAPRRDELAHTVAALIPRAATAAETAAYFLVLSAFWGLIVYLALTALR
jgi:hypothetical protein